VSSPKMAFVPANQRPIRVCGTCSTDLCAHHVCRVCSDCEECDVAEHMARMQSNPLRLRARHSFKSPSYRRSWLRKLGIVEADMPDAEWALSELRGDCCPCGNRKRQYDSFCRFCFRSLGAELQVKLNLHFKHGYLQYIRQAWADLRQLGRIAK